MPGTLQPFRRLIGFRAFRWGLLVVLLLAGCYAYISYAMASGVTTLNRSALAGHPDEYGLLYQDVTFPPR